MEENTANEVNPATTPMDPASLGLVMEELNTGTEITWDEEMVLEETHNIGLSAVESLLCRICAQQSVQLVPVFGEEGLELNLANKIRWHLPIKVKKNDKLPVKVCPTCIDRLEACHELVNLCLEAEAELKDMFNVDETVDEEESLGDDSVTITKVEHDEESDEENVKRGVKRKRPFPSIELMEAMQLLRKDKEALKNAEADSCTSQVVVVDGSAEEEFEAIYLDEPVSDDVEESRVLDVSIEAVGEGLPAGQWKKANLRVKLPKDFADCDTLLKSQIVGAIQDIMIEHDKVENKPEIKQEQEEIVNEKDWTCEICGFEAQRKSSLMVHQRRNHNPSDFACVSCNKTYTNAIELQSHESTHLSKADDANWMDEEKCYVCEYCGKSFRRIKALREHNLALHSDIKPYQCDQCDRNYGSFASLEIHKATHSAETPYLCDLCGKGFKHVVNLRSHKRSHLMDDEKNRQVCDVCGKGFRSRFHLSEHMNVHKDYKPYTCEVCGKRFNKKIQLRQHGSTHSGVQPYKCHVCGIRFNRRGNMTQHLKRHEQQRKYSCRVCHESFDTLGSVLQHRKQHSQEEMEKAVYQHSAASEDQQGERLSFKCEICGKGVTKKESLAIHMRTHTGEKLFPCEVCGKRLSNKNSLTYHMRSYHTGERPFTCRYCPQTFLTREATLVHERIHTGIKPYTCSVCNMGFRCSSNLAQHVRVHSGTRPFACPHCQKCFLRKGALTVHLRTHTGERPFKCDQCNRGFTQKNDMLKHRRTHSNERPYECSMCGERFAQKREMAKHQVLHIQTVEEAPAEAIIITADGEQQLVHSFTTEGMENQQTIILHSFQ